MANFNVAAVDLGASSGRVMLSCFDSESQKINLAEIHRFKNQLQEKNGHHFWNLDYLEQEIKIGLEKILENQELHSIGIDTWGVDFVLLDKNGNLAAPTYAYRDKRTNGVMEKVFKEFGKEKLYNKTGIQFLSFNTIFQFKAMMDENPDYLEKITDFLMIPDYLSYKLTGIKNREYTNATTTQMVNLENCDWDTDILNYLKIPRSWLGDITQPNHEIGKWQSKNGQKIPVMAVASHDTASAVLASPLKDENSAYLCSGTWSLMGLDSPKSFNDELALNLNITNEGGVLGHYRVLKNIMGLWLFQRLCAEKNITDIPKLVKEAELSPAFVSLINPNNERFLNPPNMVAEIQNYCRENGQKIPETEAELARCIFDSLALLYKKVLLELQSLKGSKIKELNIVGGGSQNEFLNQLCANLCEINVYSNPIEASVLGNSGMQLIILAAIKDISALRTIISKSFPLKPFLPQKLDISKKWQEFLQLP